MRSRNKKDFFHFALLGFLIFLILSFGHSVRQGKKLMEQNQGLAFKGFTELREGLHALENRDFGRASSQFILAEKELGALEETAQEFTGKSNPFLDQGLYLDTIQQSIESGLQAARMGQELTVFVRDMSQWKENLSQGQAFLERVRQTHEKLKNFLEKTIGLHNHLTSLNADLLPLEFQKEIKRGREKTGELMALLKKLDQAGESARAFLGEKKPHQTLILLQNKNERRATGGFIGSVILLTMNRGEIMKMEAKDVYEIDSQLQERVPAPSGIDEVADGWTLRDANYSPDFPTSAKKIMWFLEHSRGPTVDTVIAVDQTVGEVLLELTGPVEVPGFPFTLKANNLDSLLSFYTEAKLSKTKTPKQLLFDLIPIFKEELFKLKDLTALVSAARGLAGEGHIQLYSENSEVLQFSETWGLDGKLPLPDPKTDMLAAISTSIGGNKSDRFMEMQVGHETQITKEGRVLDKLTLTKHHTWQPRDFLRWQRYVDYYREARSMTKTLRFILGEGPNVDYLRVYVPRGSKLLGDTPAGLKVTEDLGYTVFAFKMTVKPGETQAITLEYELPFIVTPDPLDHYRLIVGHQAGAENISLTKTFVLEKGLEMTEVYPPQALTMPLTSNQIFLVALKLL